MKVAVIGSRGFTDYKLMKRVLRELEITCVISGGALGADSLADKYAKEYDIDFLCFPADWNKYGRGAGFIRNKDIVDNADLIVAFWDGESKGAAHSIKYARSKYKEVKIVKF